MKLLLVTIGIAAALVLCVGAQEIPPNTAPPTATKSGSAVSKLDSQEKIKDSNQDKSKPVPIPFCVPCPNCCPVEQPQSKSKAEQAKADSLDSLYRGYLLATIIGVGGGFIGIALIFWQTLLVRRSANAAQMNAQAVINAQRPWLFIPMGKEFSDIEQPILIERLPGEYRISSCTFRLKNFGETPARVIEQKLRLMIGGSEDSIPNIDAFDSKDSIKEDFMFPPDESAPIQGTVYPDGRITPQEKDELLKGVTKFLWLCGYCKYVDTFNRKNSPIYETRFCYRWVPNAVSVTGSDIRSFWIMAGPREYSRAT